MATDAERIRALLGESIPVGGTDADTAFTDDQIDDLLETQGTVHLAVAEGWRIKAANYAELVDTAEGTSKRAMSDLHKNALAMVDSYAPPDSGNNVSGVTRSRPIVRR